MSHILAHYVRHSQVGRIDKRLAVAETVEGAVYRICGVRVRAQDELHAARAQPFAKRGAFSDVSTQGVSFPSHHVVCVW